MKKLKFTRTLAILALTATVLSSCDKDDDVATPGTSVSRLFVSNADTDPAVSNLSIYEPADSSAFPLAKNINTGASDGNGIVYDPAGNIGFQVGRAGKLVKVFAYNASGSVTLVQTFTDPALTSGRGAAYDAANKTLYVANNTDSSIRVYQNANALTGSVTANKVFKLNGQPWGIRFAAGKLLVLIDLARKEVQLFDNVNNLSTGTVTPTSKITIPAATRLHGLAYDAASDVLVVTEIGLASAPTIPTFPAFNEDGGIYIIEGALAKFAANSAVTATRTITGLNTGLGNPVDVAFDARAGKKLIYIAEKANKKIFTFRLTDNGNVAPANSISVTTLPESVFVDAR